MKITADILDGVIRDALAREMRRLKNAEAKRSPANRAKTLVEEEFLKVLAAAQSGRHPERDVVMLLLSFRAGLRAVEIAGLEWRDVTDASGKIRRDYIRVPGDIAKNGKERDVPIHAQLYEALVKLRKKRPNDQHICYAADKFTGEPKGGKMTADSVRKYFTRGLFTPLGLEGVSSHSGRRTFITELAKKANLYQCSLEDVRLLAGHSSIETTKRYIEPSKTVSSLVNALGV